MVLRTQGLVKEYRRRRVVNEVSIEVNQGEIVGLLGPNGAGKTTTFYMTVGLVHPDKGAIFLDEEEITGYPVYQRARRGVGYLSQEASIFRKMTVEDNLRTVLEMGHYDPAYRKEKIESLLREFGLQKVRKNLGDRLSGGERRRAEIARCLAIDPKFIMLDEPFAGVDPIAVQDIQTIVAKLREKKIGILITDHNVYETLSICDRAYLLFEGKVLFEGTSDQLSDNHIVREKYLGKDFVLRKKNYLCAV
jgi:lipopolysaccharide export system ATP-binding protein